MQWLRDRFLQEGPGIPKDAPRRTGLALLGEILRREWWELVKLNLMFLLFSLPLVTLPAAFAATSRICVAMVEDQNCYLLRDFWHTFHSRLWQATFMGAAISTALAVAAYAIFIYAQLAVVQIAYVAPLALCLGALLAILFMAAHLFVLMAKRELGASELLRLAFLCSLAAPLPILAALGFVALLWLFHVVFYPVSVFMPAMFNLSLGALAVTFAAHKATESVLGLQQPVDGSQAPATAAMPI
jgi:uncharacterized membrane protein YesL